MQHRKPHVAVFFGGTSNNRDLSTETGYWVCQYVPRNTYRVTPVQITDNGMWRVPLGHLPQHGSVTRVLDMLFQAVPAVSPSVGLERLFRTPVDSLMTVVRGPGGDDGALHGLGATLGIPVVGSSASTCQQTSDKHACMQRLADVGSVPFSRRFVDSASPDAIAQEVRDHFIPPVVVKPALQEGSVGVEVVHDFDSLLPALRRVQAYGDVLVQEKLPGQEVSVTVFDDERGRLHVLPPTTIVPRMTDFYDHLAKRKQGRVGLQTTAVSDNHLLAEVAGIAEDVYRELGCTGLVGVDCIVTDDAPHVLEVNTVPTFTELTPLRHQLSVARVHPGALIDQLVRRSLS